MKDDCLTIIYRLLFLFYAESREELEILPVGDEVYKRGYSLESLRDLEWYALTLRRVETVISSMTASVICSAFCQMAITLACQAYSRASVFVP